MERTDFYSSDHLRRISKFARGGKLLDIGCSTGYLLDVASRLGYEAVGLELVSKAADYGRARGRVIFESSLEEAVFPSEHFDVIMANHLIEHVPHPESLVAEIHRILHPDGVLYLTVPYYRGLKARVLRDRWDGYHATEHFWHFTPRTLDHLVRAAGPFRRRWTGFSHVGALDAGSSWSRAVKRIAEWVRLGEVFHCVYSPLPAPQSLRRVVGQT